MLLGIPVTLYLVQQQQNIRGRAQQTTTLSFLYNNADASAVTAKVGDLIPLDLWVDPGVNEIQSIRLEVLYDPTKLELNTTNAWVPNAIAFPYPLDGPTYTSGKFFYSVQSTTTDFTRTIKTRTKVGTLTFKAKDATAGIPTQVTIGTGSQVLSAGAKDMANENVLLSNSAPAKISITGNSLTAPPVVTASPSAAASNTTPQPQAVNQPPNCLSLNTDRGTTGAPPFSLTFTVTGNDPDGTIQKATFQFGDGPVTNVAVGGGIGTSNISVPVSHTFMNAGSYDAYALLTDEKGALSNYASCKKTIIVQAVGGAQGNPGVAQTNPVVQSPQATPSAKIPITGPQGLIYGMGALVGGVTLIGAVLFFAL